MMLRHYKHSLRPPVVLSPTTSRGPTLKTYRRSWRSGTVRPPIWVETVTVPVTENHFGPRTVTGHPENVINFKASVMSDSFETSLSIYRSRPNT